MDEYDRPYAIDKKLKKNSARKGHHNKRDKKPLRTRKTKCEICRRHKIRHGLDGKLKGSYVGSDEESYMHLFFATDNIPKE